jgi:hypothetical protein
MCQAWYKQLENENIWAMYEGASSFLKFFCLSVTTFIYEFVTMKQ